MDRIDDIDNSELIKIIENLQIQPETKTPDAFYDALLNAQLLIPAIIKNDNNIDIIKIKNRKGKQFLSAFTDKKNLHLNNEPTDGVVFTIENYLEVIKKDDTISGVVINPYSNNLVLSRSNLKYIEKLLNIKNNREIVVGIPTDYPKNLVNDLITYFDSYEKNSVNQAFLLQIIRGNEPSLLIVIDTDKKDDFLSELGTTVKPLLKDNQIVDLILFNTDFGQEVTRGYEPFYKK